MNDDGWSEIELECLLCLMAGSGQTFDVSYRKLPNPINVSSSLLLNRLLPPQLMCLVHMGKCNKMRGNCIAGM